MSKIDTSERQRREDLCLQCMECCKIIAVQAPYCIDNKDFVEFYHTRGCAIIATKSLPVIVIENKCPHLTDKGCDIYNRRPEWCRMYDGRIDPVLRHVCLWGKGKENGRN